MSFSFLKVQEITKDKSKITLVNNLLKDVVKLKLDKRNGIVLPCTDHYRT